MSPNRRLLAMNLVAIALAAAAAAVGAWLGQPMIVAAGVLVAVLMAIAVNLSHLPKVPERSVSAPHSPGPAITETQLQTVLDAATHVCLFATDAQGTLTMFNVGSERILGYSADELVGKETPLLWHLPDEIEARARELQQQSGRRFEGFDVLTARARDESVEASLWTVRRKDGSLATLSQIITPLCYVPGEIAGFVIVALDVTGRKRTEEALKAVVTGTGGATSGEVFFKDLVRHLARALNVRYAMLAEVIDPDQPDRARTLAMWCGDGFVDNFEYDLVGTPCECLRTRTMCCYPEGVSDRFPDATRLTEMNVQSYMGMPLFDSSDRPVGLLTIMNDRRLEQVLLGSSLLRVFSTRAAAELERRRSERDLAEARALLLAAIGQCPAGILIADAPDCRIRHANSAALGIRGETSLPLTDIPVDLHPQNWQTFHPDGSPFEPEDLPLSQAVLHGRTSENVDVIIRRQDGQERWVLANAAPILNEQGEVVAGVVVFPDVTELKRAEEEAGHLRNFLNNIIDSMPSILVGVDSEARITHWNRRASEATRLDPSQVLGQPLEAALPDLKDQLDEVREAIRHREPRTKEKIESRDKNEYRYTDMMVYPLVANGVEGAVIRLDDVTEQVRILEMMIQSEKMATVGGLAAGMAHEINNPLGAILQGAQNIQRRTSTELPRNLEVAREFGTDLDTIRAYLDQREIFSMLDGIRESGERAARIVSHMLQFSRPGRGVKEPVALPELIERTIELAANDYDLRKRFDFRHIEIQRDFDLQMGEVPCCPMEIEQVLLNLFKNAAQAMEKCDRVPRIRVRVRREHRHALIEVEDNGPGMDEYTKAHIFDPFFTTKEAGSGTGLGLSVSYMIVTNNHGGSMEVESAPDVGTTFMIRLPLEAMT